jgi:hypothetical protein
MSFNSNELLFAKDVGKERNSLKASNKTCKTKGREERKKKSKLQDFRSA